MGNHINAEIVADSISPQGDRITTMKITLPRIVLAEFNTHRMFSRNSASSRAIPFAKMVEAVQTNPFVPIAFQCDHKGMQGTEYITDEKIIRHKTGIWLDARAKAVKSAEELYYPLSKSNSVFNMEELKSSSVTKQLCNRLLEPFMYHTVLVTATEFENFFNLRCPQYAINNLIDGDDRLFKSKKDLLKELDYDPIFPNTALDWLSINTSQAEIHIQAIAELMYDALSESVPKQLEAGEWHIPFGDNIDLVDWLDFANSDGILDNNLDLQDELFVKDKVKIATAMCARVSYTVVGEERKANYGNDIKLHDILAKSGHWSPFEHCAKAMTDDELDNNLLIEDGKTTVGVSRNFRGFIQYRSLIDNKEINE